MATISTPSASPTHQRPAIATQSSPPPNQTAVVAPMTPPTSGPSTTAVANVRAEVAVEPGWIGHHSAAAQSPRRAARRCSRARSRSPSRRSGRASGRRSISVTATTASQTGHVRCGVSARTATVSPAGGKKATPASGVVRYQNGRSAPERVEALRAGLRRARPPQGTGVLRPKERSLPARTERPNRRPGTEPSPCALIQSVRGATRGPGDGSRERYRASSRSGPQDISSSWRARTTASRRRSTPSFR